MSLPSEQTWLILVDLLTDLNKKGFNIPKDINSELGLIRSSINVYKRDPSHPEMINSLAKADMSMANIQGTLIDLASEVNEEYLNKWLDLLKLASKGKYDQKMPRSESRFLVNTPPGMSAGRITLKKPLAEERVQEIAEYNGIIIEFDDDITVAIYGDKNNVQDGLKEMGPFFSE